MRKDTDAMLKKKFCILLLLFADILCHPTLEVPGENGTNVAPPEVGLTFNDDTPQGSTHSAKLQQFLGTPGSTHRPRLHVTRPQFMTDLFNIVTDRNGVKRGETPYNANIVKSFIERDSSLSHLYAFNFTGLETNESLLAAELHLHLKKTSLGTIHLADLLTSYYVIRVYQVLDEHQLDSPDSHALLTVHRVAADASGWQVLDVKKAILSWMSGAPNLGFLVTVSNSLGGDAAVHFTRGIKNNGKEPVLVLFTDDSVKTTAGQNSKPARRHEYEDDLDAEDEEDTVYSSSQNGDSVRVSTSMDVYKWASNREELSRVGKIADAESQTLDSTSEAVRSQRRSRSMPKVSTITAPAPADSSGCSRHELYVDFKEIGWNDWIIAPAGYQAYQCKGHCNLSLNKNLTSTNHAQVQNLVHLMTGVDYTNAPCCVPSKLQSISVLYLVEPDNVILKRYKNMVVEECGCH